MRNVTKSLPSSKYFLESLRQVTNGHALERRNLRVSCCHTSSLLAYTFSQPNQFGKIYAFGISAGARHKRSASTINLGHTKFYKQSHYTESELRQSDGELLGAAAVTWALIAAHVPVEITNELGAGISSLGIPSFFSPVIDGGGKHSTLLHGLDTAFELILCTRQRLLLFL